MENLPNRKRPGRQQTPKFLAVDFFCGAGGTTRGLIDAGGYVIAGIDKVDSCKETYISNNGNECLDRNYPKFMNLDVFPKTNDYPEGQQKELFQELDKLIPAYRIKSPSVPLLFAICAPCQPFTKVNKATLTEERIEARVRDQDLLSHATKFIKRFQPELVLSENVAGIRDPKFGGVWQRFAEQLSDIGYETSTQVVCTSNFGIPQYRKRSILVAVKRKPNAANLRKLDLEIPTADVNAKNICVKEALKDLPPIGAGEQHPKIPNHNTRGLNDLNTKRISYSIPGESNAYLENTPEGDLSLTCHRKVNKKFGGRCFGDAYTRMSPDKPSPTITTRCSSITNGRFGHYDTQQNRGISMREAARLQTFRDDYIFHPSHCVAPTAKMIGNAVPPKLAQFFATFLINQIV